MMQSILVCGFEPYGGRTSNPSAVVAQALDKRPDVTSLVLPVIYDEAETALRAGIESVRPVAVLILGMWGGSGIKLERLAINLDDSPERDEQGYARQGSLIDPMGPPAYWSTLPLEALIETFDKHGLPCEWSRDAGGFLCNHCFYVAAHILADAAPPVPNGLVHVPAGDKLSADRLIAALEDCLDYLIQ